MLVQRLGHRLWFSHYYHRYGDPLSEQGKEWVTTVLAASVFGFIFAGYIGAKRSGEKYIVMNHNTKYPHAMQAQVNNVLELSQTLTCGAALRGL